jgi:midasin
MESSNFAEFAVRLQLIKAFEQYLSLVTVADEKKKRQLISVLFNLHLFFDQFSVDIETQIKTVRMPIEKQLRDFVKIESFNKDLSYFSMKNNIVKVHRQIHKFLKEFETALKTRVVAVFVQKDLGGELAQSPKGKVVPFEERIKYYMVDPANFIVPPQAMAKPTSDAGLLQRVEKLFAVSRNIVKETIENLPYSNLISHLDTMMHEQIENCEHLRGLEVNREQTRPKQIAQAKQFLNQKRKALADFYKTLQTIGLSYKSGLLQNAIAEEHVDLKLPPLALAHLTTVLKEAKNDQHLVCLNDKLDLYFAKSCFKLKLLTKVLLSPNAELGFGNLERIRGYAIDFFRLVQTQRRHLAKQIGAVAELRRCVRDLNDLNEMELTSESPTTFEQDYEKVSVIHNAFGVVRNGLEQFLLLLKCAPSRFEENRCVFEPQPESQLHLQSDKFKAIKRVAEKILLEATLGLADIEQHKVDQKTFLSATFVQGCEARVLELQTLVGRLKEEFLIRDELYSVYGKSIFFLDEFLMAIVEQIQPEEETETEDLDAAQLDKELEATVQTMLVAMQSVYKVHTSDKVVESSEEIIDEIEDQHLTVKIIGKMSDDLSKLNVKAVVQKISKFLALAVLQGRGKNELAGKLLNLRPLLAQYEMLCEYYLIQQVGGHKVSTKMLCIMLSVFVELGSKGFCTPQDLLQDVEETQENHKGDAFGFEDGEGEKDASDK